MAALPTCRQTAEGVKGGNSVLVVLKRISDRINQVIEEFLWVLLAVEICTIFIQVVTRKLAISILGTEELARLIFIWISFMGSTVAWKRGSHISINIADLLLPPKMVAILKRTVVLFVLAFSVLLVAKGYEVVTVARMQTSPGLHISMFWAYVVIPVTGIIMALHTLVSLFEDFSSFFRRETLTRRIATREVEGL